MALWEKLDAECDSPKEAVTQDKREGRRKRVMCKVGETCMESRAEMSRGIEDFGN